MATILDGMEVLTPSETEVSAARDLEARLLAAPGAHLGLVVTVAGEEPLILDRSAEFVRALIHEIARGHPVGLVDLDDELTTTQAAELLGVSRPTLVGLLKDGHIPHRMVGSHRRIPRAALLAYKREHRAAPDAPLDARLRATDSLLSSWHDAEEAAGS